MRIRMDLTTLVVVMLGLAACGDGPAMGTAVSSSGHVDRSNGLLDSSDDPIVQPDETVVDKLIIGSTGTGSQSVGSTTTGVVQPTPTLPQPTPAPVDETATGKGGTLPPMM